MNFTHAHPERAHIVFVCTGNICRSPMAEIIVRDALETAGIAHEVLVQSCGIGGWHVGQRADHRALAELRNAGLDGREHRATQLGAQHQTADLFIALDKTHVRDLKAWGIARSRIRLLRSFDPESPTGAEVADPYYGDADAFTQTRTEIEAATPGLLHWVKEHLATTSAR